MARAAPVSAGERDQIISVQKRVAGVDARGQHTESWSDHLAGLWARVRPVRGREFFAAGAMQAPAQLEVAILWRPNDGITPAMAVLWNGKRYPLVADPVNVDAANHTIELFCAGAQA